MKRFLFLSIALLSCAVAIAQNLILVKGYVRDSYGDPLIGAVVMVKGSASDGTLTDMNGRYQILCRKGATLVCSYIGLNSSAKMVKDNPNINFTLSEPVVETFFTSDLCDQDSRLLPWDRIFNQNEYLYSYSR